MEIIRFVKRWILPCAMVLGACVYLLFSRVRPLEPVGDAVGPLLLEAMPVLIFAMLYVTFCKIRLHDLRLAPWHIWLQVIRVAVAGLLVLTVVVVLSLASQRFNVAEGVKLYVLCRCYAMFCCAFLLNSEVSAVKRTRLAK